ncbi:MAG: methylglyoxal synthase [Candidatus Sericytochromatia bacterium]
MSRTLALVAHDACKPVLIDWAQNHRARLLPHRLICTGTTGRLVAEALGPEAQVQRLKSGPLGGDQQLGALIAEEQIDLLIFLWDPMLTQPHDVDVKALLRLAVVYNVPTACNLATADFLIVSEAFHNGYRPQVTDYSGYLARQLPPSAP